MAGRIGMCQPYCLGRGVAGLQPHHSKLDSNYLWYWIVANKKTIARHAKGSTFKQIKKEDIEKLPIPMPPLAEQKRIAAILDKADAIRRKRQAAIKLADDFLRATFLNMFGDPVTNPKDWKIKRLAEVCNKITDGVHLKPEYTDRGVPFISVKNITTGNLVFDECKYISEEDHLRYCKRCKPEYMDILYTKVGATYGRPALVDVKDEFSLYVSVALIKPDKGQINPIFLKEALANPALKHQADRSIKGAGVPDLHLVEIKGFKVPVPPMEIQNNFVNFASRLRMEMAKHMKALESANDLFHSLSQRAFNGDL